MEALTDAPAQAALPAQGQKRLLTMDALKGLCIIMVILTHAGLPAALKKAIFYPGTILPAVPMFLMLSVFAFSLSEDRHGGDILSWFGHRSFWRRAGRFLVPYIAAIAVLLISLYLKVSHIKPATIIKMIFTGGRGPGSYYVVVTWQFLILFPFMRAAFRRSPALAAVGFVAAQIAYEYLCGQWAMPQAVYRLLIFKFLIPLSLGFLLYQYRDALRKTALPVVCILIGGLYLAAVYYFGYKQHLLFSGSSQTGVASLWSFGLLCLLLGLEPFLQKRRKAFAPLCYMGRASFHILLTQMVYFYSLSFHGITERIESRPLFVAAALVVTISVGCLFYFLEQQCRRLVKRKNN